MTTEVKTNEATTAPAKSWLVPVLLTWIAPGSGYFLLKNPGRGALMGGISLVMFLLGLLMRGAFFEPQTGDMLTTVIYCGGWLGNLANGSLYLLAKAFGYSAPDTAGHVVDYGAKFLVASGLINVLAIIDVFEIATGKKN
jgi:hypothetical protein